MSHDHARDRAALANLQDQLVNDVGHDRIEPCRRLVVEHHLGIDGESPGQSDAFAHAAGQLSRLLRFDVRGQADLLQTQADDVADLGFREPALLAQTEGDVVIDRQTVEKCGSLE